MILIKWLCRSDSYQMWGRENDSIINRDRSEGKAGMGRKAIILKKGKKGR